MQTGRLICPTGWKVMDSNHRRRSRQIYSLIPLATRETFPLETLR